MPSLAIHGAAGRMGRRLIALATENSNLKLVAAVEFPGHPDLGKDAGSLAGVGSLGLGLSSTLDVEPDVIIDFSSPQGTRKIIPLCAQRKIPLVVGTTGLTGEDHQAIAQAAGQTAILQAANMSLGVNLLIALAAKVARQLGDDYDIEITEAHHRFKKDSPSGTALAIAGAICQATGKSVDRDLVHGRQGADTERRRGQIGMHALRLGDIVGKHDIHFASLGEEIVLAHTATTRDVFARGALRAAQWLADKPAGRYSMADVLGL
ncbi:MAG: 4-hydroxy-tetrahydrodipicolinate reductase [Phycisphaeraceae bacterium]|nr:4-hydroxy-tetrahydrodipicolinate reductase [Phycisphaeraceae bacterium]